MFSRQTQRIFNKSLNLVRDKSFISTPWILGTNQCSRNIRSVPVNKEIYELRTYAIYPNKMKEFLSVTNDEFQLRTKHSKLVAYWVTEIGGINEVVHLWAYDDLDHRAEVRSGLAKNEEWNTKFLAKVGPMLQKMDNMLLNLHPSSPAPELSKESAVFELQLCQMGSQINQWTDSLKALIGERKKLTSNSATSLVGVWNSVIGHQNMCAILWQHGSPHDVFKFNSKILTEDSYSNFTGHVSSQYTKMLNPFIKHLWSDEPFEEKMSW